MCSTVPPKADDAQPMEQRQRQTHDHDIASMNETPGEESLRQSRSRREIHDVDLDQCPTATRASARDRLDRGWLPLKSTRTGVGKWKFSLSPNAWTTTHQLLYRLACLGDSIIG
jgi:hypothetical protein